MVSLAFCSRCICKARRSVYSRDLTNSAFTFICWMRHDKLYLKCRTYFIQKFRCKIRFVLPGDRVELQVEILEKIFLLQRLEDRPAVTKECVLKIDEFFHPVIEQ